LPPILFFSFVLSFPAASFADSGGNVVNNISEPLSPQSTTIRINISPDWDMNSTEERRALICGGKWFTATMDRSTASSYGIDALLP
jgi:hypothetical protein